MSRLRTAPRLGVAAALMTGAVAVASPSPTELLRLRPLEGPRCSPGSDGESTTAEVDVTPAGIAGLRSLRLGWTRRPTLKLTVLVSATPGEYVQEVNAESTLPDPAWADFDTLPFGDMLVISIGWGITPRLSGARLACEHYVSACRTGAGGVPACAAPVLVARAPRCSAMDYGAGLPDPTPQVRGRKEVPDMLVADGVTFRPEDLTLTPLGRPSTTAGLVEFPAQDLGTHTGIRAVELLSKANELPRSIAVTTTRGETFVGHRLPRPPPKSVRVGKMTHREMNGTLLVGWNLGWGGFDSPEGTFRACQHVLVACRLDAHDVPWCSDAFTLERGHRCSEKSQASLVEELPEPVWAAGGSAFRIAGRGFRVELPELPAVHSGQPRQRP